MHSGSIARAAVAWPMSSISQPNRSRILLTCSLAAASTPALAQEGTTTVQISQVATSSSGMSYEVLRPEELTPLAPGDYQPTRPPTAKEVDAATTPEQLIELYERELKAYIEDADTFKTDIRDLILTRYGAEKERIAGHYDREVRELEAQERQRRLEAIARFEEFLKKYPNDPFYTPDAMFRLAELYFERSSDEYLAKTKQFERDLAAYEKGELTEGTRTNLVLEIGGERLTPARECGLLAGVFRRSLLERDYLERLLDRF